VHGKKKKRSAFGKKWLMWGGTSRVDFATKKKKKKIKWFIDSHVHGPN
jgi:hypothetical protein